MKILFFLTFKSNQIKFSQGKNQTSMLVMQFIPQTRQQNTRALGSTLLCCLGERQLKLYPIFLAKQTNEPKHIKFIYLGVGGDWLLKP
jgi:hypothetical protein